MTLPDERYRAVKNTQQFLRDLLDPKKTPRVPRTVRLQARTVLKHFPDGFHLDEAAKRAPEVFKKPARSGDEERRNGPVGPKDRGARSR